jgi:hypothetical protein
MNSVKPPRLAAWILQEFGPELNQEALAGDLNEAFQQGRSKAWYWRQVMAAVRWRSLLFRLLLLIAWGWWMTSPSMSGNSALVSRPLDIAIFVAGMLAAGHLPRMLRGRLRALLAVLIVAFFCLLHRDHYDIYNHYSILGLFFLFSLVLLRKAPAPPPYHLTLRELVYGNPDAERQRLMEKLHLAMLQETDPEVRHAYAESIAALKRNASSTVKGTQ